MATQSRPTRFDLVVVGDANPDLVLSSPDLRVEFGQREALVEDATLTLGGSAAITACAAARLGLRTAMVGLVGDDAFGRFCLDELRAAGVDVSAVAVDLRVPTAITVVLQREDDRAMVTHAAAIEALRPSHLDPAVLRAARHVHVGSYYLLDGLRDGLAAALAPFRAGGGTVSVDTNWDPTGTFDVSPIAAFADILLPNAEEARRFTGEDDLAAAARTLARSVGTVAITDGLAGAIGGRGGAVVRAPAPAVDPERVVDAIGAGDTFDAGYVAAHLDGRSLDGCLRLGLAAAALSVQGRGGTGAPLSRASAEALA